jgi:hypothetical protein
VQLNVPCVSSCHHEQNARAGTSTRVELGAARCRICTFLVWRWSKWAILWKLTPTPSSLHILRHTCRDYRGRFHYRASRTFITCAVICGGGVLLLHLHMSSHITSSHVNSLNHVRHSRSCQYCVQHEYVSYYCFVIYVSFLSSSNHVCQYAYLQPSFMLRPLFSVS